METQNELVQMTGDGVLSRRSFPQASTAATVGGLGFLHAVKSEAAELRKKGLSCILLFMNGAPSQFETFDPKPGTTSGGETKAIDTAVSGVQIADLWPNVAKQMKEIALIRSMTSREFEHQRAQYLLHTGYQAVGSIKFPNFGAIAAKELGDPKFDLPHFVCVAGSTPASAGFLGMQYAPYQVRDPNRMPLNSQLLSGVDAEALKRRLALMGKLEKDFADAGGESLVVDHKAVNETAARMVLSPHLKAFDLSKENAKVRDAYGRTPLGQGCLMARRLVEKGVTCVEVVSNGRDTHEVQYEGHKRHAAVME